MFIFEQDKTYVPYANLKNKKRLLFSQQPIQNEYSRFIIEDLNIAHRHNPQHRYPFLSATIGHWFYFEA